MLRDKLVRNGHFAALKRQRSDSKKLWHLEPVRQSHEEQVNAQSDPEI